MSIRKLRAGRVPGVTANQYVGVHGTIFWNELTGEFRLSDGVTPGGSRVGFPVASSTEIGGLKLGPGTLLNNNNQLVIDSTGLDFSFGDFQATVSGSGAATLSSINTDQNIDIVSNGTGLINIVGDFHVHRTLDYDPNSVDPDGAVFAIKGDGQIQMKVPLSDVTTGALEIIGNDTGLFFPPDQTGVILHVTGNSGLTSRSYFDANGNYSLLAGRRYNGTQLNPTKVLNGEVFFRIAGQAATQSGTEDAVFQTLGPARLEWVATQDQQPNKQGGELRIYATANDTAATAAVKVATFNATTGLTATKFNGPLTGNVTGKADTAGNADTVTNGVYTNGSYANPSWITSLAASKVGLGSVENTALSTSTHYIGTTSIQYNRASASQTLTGVSIDGNAGTVTNGVVTTGSYSDPSWLTISKSKVGLSNVDNTADANKNVLFATTAGGAPATDVYAWAKAATKPSYTKSEVGLSAVENTALSTWAGSSNITTVGTLTNLSIATGGTITTPRVIINDGGIRTVNSGTALTIDFAVDSIILWTAPSGTAAITLQNYTAGASVKLMIAMTTSRDVTYGISAAANSSTGADNFNGAGGGSVSIANTTMFLDYVCMSGVAGGCYVSVNVL